MLLRPVQPSKALIAITSKLLGSVTEVSPVQSINAHALIYVTVFGIETAVRLLRKNAYGAIPTTPSSITTVLICLPYHGT